MVKERRSWQKKVLTWAHRVPAQEQLQSYESGERRIVCCSP
jgi:hypothetical protein